MQGVMQMDTKALFKLGYGLFGTGFASCHLEDIFIRIPIVWAEGFQLFGIYFSL